jgi:homoserine dehydrogenase
MAADPEIDVVVELIGGADGIARQVLDTALDHGKHVVTANKALMAHDGTRLAARAEERGLILAFEAAVAGGIPVIKGLREGLAGNRMERVYGILNGTSNYILTTMRESAHEFSEVLAEAQKLGYAEADPSFDIDGIDAAHKLAILASVGFGRPVDFGGVYTEGIRHVSRLDIDFAEELGYRIKLLGIARRLDGGIDQRVQPAMVRAETPLADVDAAFNAVSVNAGEAGPFFFEGRGAGEGPTASAVIADLVDIALGSFEPAFGKPANTLTPLVPASPEATSSAYYLRFEVLDIHGVLAEIAGCLADFRVSIESMLQRSRNPGEPVSLVMITHDTPQLAVARALKAIGASDKVLAPPVMIPMEAG